MSSTAYITEEQAGAININGYKISISEGDTLDKVMGKIIDGVNITGVLHLQLKTLIMIQQLMVLIMQVMYQQQIMLVQHLLL